MTPEEWETLYEALEEAARELDLEARPASAYVMRVAAQMVNLRIESRAKINALNNPAVSEKLN